jgi:type III pantothenate kinase
MHLLIDIGNSRVKWAELDGGVLERRGHAAHRESVDAALGELEDSFSTAPESVIVANVAGLAMAEKLGALCRRRLGLAPEFVAVRAEQFGVRCAYADPARLGVDRWVALLGAHRAVRGAVCVISAGTAVTFDAVDAGGSHLGGLILAGPRLAAAALERHTSDIGPTTAAGEPPRGLDLLGRSTDTAVAHGAWLAIAAALDRAVATVSQALGTAPTVYLTGGDAARVAAWLETEAELRADLVLEGLALFARPGARVNVES